MPSDAQPGLRERNRARTHAEIADAALELFERQGFDATTVDQIAAAAGVSAATFFRYFAAKEDVLFTDEEASAADLVDKVARRTDRSPSVGALTDPVVAFARSMPGPMSPNSRRLTNLVMTTPSLAPRSLRMRLRWERDVAAQLASESGLTSPELVHTVVASLAVSCLTSGLRHWPNTSPHALGSLVREAFDLATS